MNAADHLAASEQLLAGVPEHYDNGFMWEAANMSLQAIAHGLLAVALEIGVPPVLPAPPGGASGT